MSFLSDPRPRVWNAAVLSASRVLDVQNRGRQMFPNVPHKCSVFLSILLSLIRQIGKYVNVITLHSGFCLSCVHIVERSANLGLYQITCLTEGTGSVNVSIAPNCFYLNSKKKK